MTVIRGTTEDPGQRSGSPPSVFADYQSHLPLPPRLCAAEVIRQRKLGCHAPEPLDDLWVIGDAPLTADLFLLVLGEAGVQDALVARCRLRVLQCAQVLVEVSLEVIEVGERLDIVGHEVVRGAGAPVRASVGAGEEAGEDLHHDRQAVALV